MREQGLKPWKVNVENLASGTSLSELRLGDDGVRRANGSDGSTVFSFETNYNPNIITSPIPTDKLQGSRLILGYDKLNLNDRSTNLIDRNGDGLKELLIGPSPTDPTLFSATLSGTGSSSSISTLFARAVSQSIAGSGSFLWDSNGSQPINELGPDKAGYFEIRKVNGVKNIETGGIHYGTNPDYQSFAETGGDLGVNGASLSRQMMHFLSKPTQSTVPVGSGQYSSRIGGGDLRYFLQNRAESFELKVPAYVWAMKSKGDGIPQNMGVDDFVIHIGSGQDIFTATENITVGAPSTSAINLDGLAVCFNANQQTFSLFWNGNRLIQLGPSSSEADLALLLSSADSKQTGSELLALLKRQANDFMAPDGGLHNSDGLDKGYELMSILGNWFDNLFTLSLIHI